VLNATEATELFARIIGPQRTSDARARADVVRLCGYMPLAIQVVASRLSHHPAWTVADLSSRLANTQSRLREIRGDELEVASSFELSYRYLSSEQRRAFRQIGCHAGLDFSLHAAAAASNATVPQTERVLDALLDCHLLEEPDSGRFRCHDLIRDYATELALREDTADERQLCAHRLLDYYLHQAGMADRILYPHRRRLAAETTFVPAEVPEIADQHAAHTWMAAERLNLLSAVQYAAKQGFSSHTRLLPHVISQFLEAGGYWQETAVAHGCALEAWRAARDRHGEAQAHADLCVSRVRAGHFSDALEHGNTSVETFRSVSDQEGEAEALDRLGLVLWQGARFREALARFGESLAIHGATGNRYGQAEVLGHLGIGHWHVGDYSEAIASFQRALALYRELADRRGEAKALNNIGDVEQRMGAHDDALAHYQQALPIAHDIGGRQPEAILLNNIGTACQHIGRYAEALDHLRKALGIYRDIGDRRCEADALNNIGTTYRRMQHNDESLIHHQKALDIARSIGEDFVAAHALRSLGDTSCEMGRGEVALGHHRQALDLSRRIGDPYEEASCLHGMGNALRLTRDEAAARECWHQALTLFERIGVPEADTVRARLGREHHDQ
jgi:tetratricopeptide (TPR) repeat protein